MPGFVPAFEPIFPSPALQQQANSICGNDQFCLFDIATTGRTDIGLSTLLGGIELEMITNISQPGKLKLIQRHLAVDPTKGEVVGVHST